MKCLLISLAALCVVACTVDAQGMRPSPGYNPTHNIPRTRGFKLPHRFRRDAPEEPQNWPGHNPRHNIPRNPGFKLPHRFRRDAPEEPQNWPGHNPRHNIPRNPGFKLPHRFRRDAPEEPQNWPGHNPRHNIPRNPGFKLPHRFRRDAPEEPQNWPGHNPTHNIPRNPGFKLPHRFRRDAPEEPQGSVVFQGVQPLSGPDRQPTLDLNYKQQIIDNDRTKLDAFGGANVHGGRVSPQVGFGVEHNFNKDMFVRGHGQVEQGARGRLSPSFGADFGWRFRRDAPEEPQGSVVLQGVQPLSGPGQPTLDLNYQQRIIDNDRTKLDAFGGANLHNGRVSPQAGFGVEHNFNKDMFVRGHGQVEQGPRGRFSPSFGADFGWRFRRDVETSEDEKVLEEDQA